MTLYGRDFVAVMSGSDMSVEAGYSLPGLNGQIDGHLNQLLDCCGTREIEGRVLLCQGEECWAQDLVVEPQNCCLGLRSTWIV